MLIYTTVSYCAKTSKHLTMGNQHWSMETKNVPFVMSISNSVNIKGITTNCPYTYVECEHVLVSELASSTVPTSDRDNFIFIMD